MMRPRTSVSRRFNPLLYAILDKELLGKRSITKATKNLIAGGATTIQLREPPQCLAKDFLKDARKVQSALKTGTIKFIINDRPDIARAVDADGVHLGQDDLPIEWARKILGKNKLIGISVATVRQARMALASSKTLASSVNYLGVGPVFRTPTKPDARHTGLGILRAIKKISRVPVVAIGGINEKNVRKVLAAGADGVAVISALLKRGTIKRNTRQLKKAILQTNEESKEKNS
jgi:thiamine-phosphate pyrophosphorylase